MSIKISSIASISGWPFKSTEDALTDDEWAAMSEAYFNQLEEKDVALDEAADRINLLNLFVREGQQIHRLISRKCCQRWQENTVAAMVPDAATCQGMIHRFCEEPLFTFANPCSYQKSTYQFFFEHFILLSIGANCVCLALYDPLDEMEDSDKAITLYWIEFVLLIHRVARREAQMTEARVHCVLFRGGVFGYYFRKRARVRDPTGCLRLLSPRKRKKHKDSGAHLQAAPRVTCSNRLLHQHGRHLYKLHSGQAAWAKRLTRPSTKS